MDSNSLFLPREKYMDCYEEKGIKWPLSLFSFGAGLNTIDCYLFINK